MPAGAISLVYVGPTVQDMPTETPRHVREMIASA
jgi:hypothetical protein